MYDFLNTIEKTVDEIVNKPAENIFHPDDHAAIKIQNMKIPDNCGSDPEIYQNNKNEEE